MQPYDDNSERSDPVAGDTVQDEAPSIRKLADYLASESAAAETDRHQKQAYKELLEKLLREKYHASDFSQPDSDDRSEEKKYLHNEQRTILRPDHPILGRFGIRERDTAQSHLAANDDSTQQTVDSNSKLSKYLE